MHLVLIVVSAIVTAALLGWEGLVAGALLGYCLAEVVALKRRIVLLEQKLAKTAEISPAESASEGRPGLSGAETAAGKASDPRQNLSTQQSGGAEEVIFTVAHGQPEPAGASGAAGELPEQASAPSVIEYGAAAIRRFMTEGNPVVKIGLVVLFFGVAFLLKYAADRSLLSIESRLVLTALAGASLVMAGWRLRDRPMGYGLGLQGGGVGVLYLTTFAAAKFYTLIPMSAALLILVGLVVFSGALSLLQEARVLAAMGAIGGFLAPVLMATGAGDHILLFSYYAVLNVGIFAIALFKSWRELNLIGFFFTFGIGSFWIYDRYSAAHFNTTEPFLILFFLLYVGIAVLFALGQPVNLKGAVDGPLVFGTPLVASMQQYLLVAEIEYGMAISVLTAGVLYLLLALFLRRNGSGGALVLSEAFLALGTVGVSLALPLAFDGEVTAAGWALEGAALIWVGLRQSRLPARAFGLLLQLGAGAVFLGSVFYPFGSPLFLNHYFLGCAWIGGGALFSSYLLTQKKASLQSWERYIAWPMLIWGTVWWYYGGVRETARNFESLRAHNALILFAAALTMLLSIVARKCNWRQLAVAQCQFLPVLLCCGVVGLFADDGVDHLFAGWGALIWAVALFTQYRMLHQFDLQWPARLAGCWHAAGLWLILLLLSYELSWYVGHSGAFADTWSLIVWGVVPALALLLLIHWGARLAWPVRRWLNYYHGVVSTVIAVALIVWLMISMTSGGDEMVWGWSPVVNGLELSQLIVLLCLLSWLAACQNEQCRLPEQLRPELVGWLLGFCTFVWTTGVVARAVHHWAGVGYAIEPLYRSVVFQAALAALWSGIALGLTLWSSRAGSRTIWLCGAGLLGCVVVKLFAIDLSGTETVARIVSFLVVGGLMLVIGYISPMPPTRGEEGG